MAVVIWLGLGLSLLGVVLLTLFGLIWIKPDSAIHDWGFRIGIALVVIGTALSVVGA